MKLYRIPDFPDYSVTKCGDVYSHMFGKLRKLKPGINSNGYYAVVLTRDKKAYSRDVHRLMGLTFLKLAPKLEVNHLNGLKLDNNISNLEVCTKSENIKHAYRLGLTVAAKGDLDTNSKLNSVEVLEIKRLLKENVLTQDKIGAIFNISRSTVSHINIGRLWKHLGE